MAISVPFPFTSRRWALPALAALYRPASLDQAENRRHKTAPTRARQLMAVLIHWFPERKFIFLGDGGYASHELAWFSHRHRRHATLVSRFRGDARLYAPAPKRRQRIGRPGLKGRRLPTPEQIVARRALTRTTVAWYGGGDRRVALASDTGLWYKAAVGVVPVRWVFVRDRQGTHRDDYFYTTDTALAARQVVSWFTARGPIETTFQEVRAHWGFETPRQHVAPSVLRTAPCLLGLFSVICLIYAEHAKGHPMPIRQRAWYVKNEPTFSDVMASVRRFFWQETIFPELSYHKDLQKLPRKVRNWMLDQLSQAA